MSIINGIVKIDGDIGISVAEVSKATGCSSQDTGTLCTSNNINIFSKFKPIQFKERPKVDKADPEYFKEMNYGINYDPTWDGSFLENRCNYSPSANSFDNLVKKIDKTKGIWVKDKVWNKPTLDGGFRILDFDGYDDSAPFPYKLIPPEEIIESYQTEASVNISIDKVGKDTSIDFPIDDVGEAGYTWKIGIFRVIFNKGSYEYEKQWYPKDFNSLQSSDFPLNFTSNMKVYTDVSSSDNSYSTTNTFYTILGKVDSEGHESPTENPNKGKYIFMHNCKAAVTLVKKFMNIYIGIEAVDMKYPIPSKLKCFTIQKDASGNILSLRNEARFLFKGARHDGKVSDLANDKVPNPVLRGLGKLYYYIGLYTDNPSDSAEHINYPESPDKYINKMCLLEYQETATGNVTIKINEKPIGNLDSINPASENLFLQINTDKVTLPLSRSDGKPIKRITIEPKFYMERTDYTGKLIPDTKYKVLYDSSKDDAYFNIE